MALPTNVELCSVTGAFVNADGTIPTGTVEFIPTPCSVVDATAPTPTTIVGTPVLAALDEFGHVATDLIATDDVDINPFGWTYVVKVRLNNAAWSFNMYAPSDEIIDLSTVTPVACHSGYAIVVGPPGEPGPAGEGLPTGGAAGEVLAKLSGDDYDTTWTAASAPGLHGSTHEAGGTDEVTITEAQVSGLAATMATKQPLDADLTTIAALAPASDTVIQRKSGVWVASTPTEYKDDLDLTKTDVGLGNVDNTSDTTKPVSTATQTALNSKAGTAVFTSSTNGLAPLSGGGAANFLRADGSWAQPPGSLAGVSNTATFSYNTTTTEPPTGNQLRLNNTTQPSATRLWVSQTTVDGLDVGAGFARILAGHQIYFQDRDDASKWIKYNVTADGTDDGTYYDFTVAYHSGPGGIPAGQVELQAIAPGTVGVPPGGTTGQAMTKTSSTDYAVAWTSVVANGGGITTIRSMTAAAYAALTPKDATTLYVVT